MTNPIEIEVGRRAKIPHVLAVCSSPGGIPKLPLADAQLTFTGLAGDGRNHTKHIRPDRAVSLWDYETLKELVAEGFSSLAPGAAGENLTVVGLSVQTMAAGTLLHIGDTILKLEQPRKPCYVLDAIDPRLKDAIVGRCGFMASVVREGTIRPGMAIKVVSIDDVSLVPRGASDPAPCPPTFALNPAGTPAGIPSRTLSPLLAGPTIG